MAGFLELCNDEFLSSRYDAEYDFGRPANRFYELEDEAAGAWDEVSTIIPRGSSLEY